MLRIEASLACGSRDLRPYGGQSLTRTLIDDQLGVKYPLWASLKHFHNEDWLSIVSYILSQYQLCCCRLPQKHTRKKINPVTRHVFIDFHQRDTLAACTC